MDIFVDVSIIAEIQRFCLLLICYVNDFKMYNCYESSAFVNYCCSCAHHIVLFVNVADVFQSCALYSVPKK